MILISDSHVSIAHNNQSAFFQMLERLEQRSDPLVFLGDIFDLWVSLPRYQEPYQKRFLEWCDRLVKSGRTVGFIEGNHEFFVVERNSSCFSWSSPSGHQEGETLFVHGDLINKMDKNYLRFRKITKNPIAKTLVRFMPMGPRLAHKAKSDLKKTNQAFRIGLPEDALIAYAREMFSRGIHHILVGHFHQSYRYEEGEHRFLQILPDWYATGMVSIYDGKTVQSQHWESL